MDTNRLINKEFRLRDPRVRVIGHEPDLGVNGRVCCSVGDDSCWIDEDAFETLFEPRPEPVPPTHAEPTAPFPTPHIPDRCVECRGIAQGAAETSEHALRVAIEKLALEVRTIGRAFRPQMLIGGDVSQSAERFITVLDVRTRTQKLGAILREDNDPRVVQIHAHEGDRVVVNGLPVWPAERTSSDYDEPERWLRGILHAAEGESTEAAARRVADIALLLGQQISRLADLAGVESSETLTDAMRVERIEKRLRECDAAIARAADAERELNEARESVTAVAEALGINPEASTVDITIACDSLLARAEAAERERDEARRRGDAAEYYRDEYKAEFDRVADELRLMSNAKIDAIADRDALRGRVEALVADNDRLQNEINERDARADGRFAELATLPAARELKRGTWSPNKLGVWLCECALPMIFNVASSDHCQRCGVLRPLDPDPTPAADASEDTVETVARAMSASGYTSKSEAVLRQWLISHVTDASSCSCNWSEWKELAPRIRALIARERARRARGEGVGR